MLMTCLNDQSSYSMKWSPRVGTAHLSRGRRNEVTSKGSYIQVPTLTKSVLSEICAVSYAHYVVPEERNLAGRKTEMTRCW